MNKIPPNLGLNNGLPASTLTWDEAIALVEENKRRGGRTVTRKSAGEQALERLQAAADDIGCNSRTNKIPPNLGLNNGVPELGLTQAEAIALVDENKRRGGRTVTRRTQTEMYEERDARERAAREKPAQGTD